MDCANPELTSPHWFVVTSNNVTASKTHPDDADKHTGNQGAPQDIDASVGALPPGANGLPGDGQILLKMLIPAYAAGSIIGKNGQTITQ